MEKLRLTIATPQKLILQDDVDEVIAPGIEGYFGVLLQHAPFLTQLKSGEINYRIDKKQHFIWVSGGFCEVMENKVTILANKAKVVETRKKEEQ